ncbi:MAG TPA: hypothetical protein K8V56_02035 [Sporosarcina psychrophila]|uniref:Uncharacterized protein n=1 Tax=Sporosarcina psychrophila TaxID=1476 RepID=A0A921FVP1_SPOPS|nr:hypothetical protein [Sporosarcina psychrophila]
MADKMMRIAGRGKDGKAKALSVNNAGDIYVSNKSDLLIDSTIDVTNVGWHVFGETSGRAHQKILDISNYKNLTILLESKGTVAPGEFSIVLFTKAGRITNNDRPFSDDDFYYQTSVKILNSNGKFVLTNSDYPIFDMPKIGIQVYFASVPAGAKIRCRILGGN